jgi:2-polyprenyl-6-methoxyphenol hydroxylase-like FAD-dependent oxidoreductase
VHRAELQSALLDAVGADNVRFGAEVVEVGPGAELGLASGERVSADVVVGADGISSVTRQAVIGDGEPDSSGFVAYRSVVAWDAEIPAGEYLGRGEVLGIAPLSRRRVYWYAAHRAEEPRGDSALELEALRARHASWAEPIPSLLAATAPADLLRHELFDRPAAEVWGHGPVTLLGDAAHPMLPFLGQGACCALEDAVALARALREGEVEPAEALRAYERERAPRSRLLVNGSRAAGRMCLMASPLGTRIRNAAMAALPDGLAGGRGRRLRRASCSTSRPRRRGRMPADRRRGSPGRRSRS